jgi:P27 family predicted phage terminase small subunit
VESTWPKCPKDLKGDARRHWNKIVPEMAKIGIISPFDWPKLRKMCQLWARMMAIEPFCKNEFTKTTEKVTTKADGTVTKSGGNVIYNPAATKLDKLFDKYDKLASQFFMGPANRAGMGGVQQKEKDDEKAKFFR